MEQLFRAFPTCLDDLGPNAATDEALAFAAWGRCAGEGLKTRTRPIEFFENRLVIAVDDKTWQTAPRRAEPADACELNALLGDGTIRFIEFRVNASAVKRTINTVV